MDHSTAALALTLALAALPAGAWGSDELPRIPWTVPDGGLDGVWHSTMASQPDTELAFFMQSSRPQDTARWLTERGARVGTVAGSVLTVRATTRDLPALASAPHLLGAEAATPIYPRLDRALPASYFPSRNGPFPRSRRQSAGPLVRRTEAGLRASP